MLLTEEQLWANMFVPGCEHIVQIRVENLGGMDYLGDYSCLKCLSCGKLFRDYGKDKETC